MGTASEELYVANGWGGQAVRLQSGTSNLLVLPSHPFFGRNLHIFTHRDSVGRPKLAAFTCQE